LGSGAFGSALLGSAVLGSPDVGSLDLGAAAAGVTAGTGSGRCVDAVPAASGFDADELAFSGLALSLPAAL